MALWSASITLVSKSIYAFIHPTFCKHLPSIRHCAERQGQGRISQCLLDRALGQVMKTAKYIHTLQLTKRLDCQFQISTSLRPRWGHSWMQFPTATKGGEKTWLRRWYVVSWALKDAFTRWLREENVPEGGKLTGHGPDYHMSLLLPRGMELHMAFSGMTKLYPPVDTAQYDGLREAFGFLSLIPMACSVLAFFCTLSGLEIHIWP